jgi:hypothetical protein
MKNLKLQKDINRHDLKTRNAVFSLAALNPALILTKTSLSGEVGNITTIS